MKKKKVFYAVLHVLLCAVLILCVSCEMFTTSLAKGARRNQKEFLKKASASELIAFSQSSYSSNAETMAAVLDLLSGKSADELKGLSLTEKEQALNLTFEATFPFSTIKKIGETAAQAGNNSVSGADVKNMVDEVINSLNSFDTAASAALLSDPEAMRKADPSQLANAAVAVLLQTTASVYQNLTNNVTPENLKAKTPQTIANDILGPGPDADGKKAALKASLEALKLLSGGQAYDSEGTVVGRTIQPEDVNLLGVVSLADVLSQFK
ncbi:hypothetical protein H0R92_09710 [Treponema sp. OMZ 840]|uniref:hypothetical protein n=1 Tax=Treponema sp. OMZ 840 TaxID=244313 RepID=UPI003D8DD481